jgi:DNA-directed RNA polymerase beta subunit
MPAGAVTFEGVPEGQEVSEAPDASIDHPTHLPATVSHFDDILGPEEHRGASRIVKPHDAYFTGSANVYPNGQDPLQTLVAPHVDSFNFFLSDGIKNVVRSLEPVSAAVAGFPEVSMWIEDVTIGYPTKSMNKEPMSLFPSECREAGTSYASPLILTVGRSVDGGAHETFEHKCGDLPVMLRSQRCHLAGMSRAELVAHREEEREFGGQFIVNGNERMMRLLIHTRRHYPVAMERAAYTKRGSTYTNMGVSMRCVRNDETSMTNVLHYLTDGSATFRVLIHRQEYFIPIVLLLRALKETSDREIYDRALAGDANNTFMSERLEMMLARSSTKGNAFSHEAARAHLGASFRNELELPASVTDVDAGAVFLERHVLVHLGHDGAAKFALAVEMLRKLYALAHGTIRPENPDSPMLQEVLLPGQLYTMLMKERLEDYLLGVKRGLEKELAGPRSHRVNISEGKWFKSMLLKFGLDIGRRMQYFLATGNIVSRSGLDLMQVSGYTVVAEKLNFYRYLSHFRSIHRGAFFAEMKTTAVRKLLPEAWGFLCPIHTPDGSPCGLLNHLGADCRISTERDDVTAIPKLMESFGMVPASHPAVDITQRVPVFLDGRVLGYIRSSRAQAVADALRVLKARGERGVPRSLELVCVPPEMPNILPGIFMFPGRCRFIRPVQNLRTGTIEEIGSFEQVFMDIAIFAGEAYPGTTTHMELHPLAMMSLVPRLTPFSDHNQSPRSIYQCLDATTPIAMADGTLRALSEVQVGDTVLAIDRTTNQVVPSAVTGAFIRPAEQPMHRVSLPDGCSVDATADHLLLTPNGWSRVDALANGDAVAVATAPVPLPHEVSAETICLDRDAVVAKLVSLNVSEELALLHAQQLEERDLLPLRSNDARLPLLAKMFGFLCGNGSAKQDGYSGPQISASFGCKADADLFVADVASFGFPLLSVHTVISDSAKHHGINATTHTFSCGSAFASLMICLGQTLGPKTETERLPLGDWILQGSLAVKQAFLSGFYGADGCRRGQVGDQVVQLLGDLGLEAAASAADKVAMGVDEIQTHIGFLSRISFAYDRLKQEESTRHLAYARYCLRCNQLSLGQRQPVVPEDHDAFLARLSIVGDVLFVPATLTPIPQTLVADIEVADHHSFIVASSALLPGAVPSSHFGLVSHNCQMGKQTMGTPFHSFPYRMDNKSYRIMTPQRPVTRNAAHDQFSMDDYPLGTNVCVAVISYTGYDMEDACIINKAALDRGLFHGVVYTTTDVVLYDPAHSKGNSLSRFLNLRKDGTKVVNALGIDGLPEPGTFLASGTTMCVSYDPLKDAFREHPYKKKEDAYVEEVRIIANGSSRIQHIRIKLRHDRSPTIGDKFSSRHGQKGVLSIKWPQRDMPFSQTGITPDVIINPHAFPSRMTIGMLIESAAGKAGALRGVFQDATPFQFNDKHRAVDKFGAELRASGYSYYGSERLYSGIYGTEMEAEIFIGVVYYQRLRHMVKDKWQVRATGPVDSITKQPVQGRKAGGGIRLGEMERDSLLSHGVSATLRDRLMLSSDYVTCQACTRCGSIISVYSKAAETAAPGKRTDREQRSSVCRLCNQTDCVRTLGLPNVSIYLVNELAAMGIKLHLDIDDASAPRP